MRWIPIVVAAAFLTTGFAQETVIVRPTDTDEVLVNPGIGFMTFQRFNGDELNEGLKWTEGYEIDYQEFKGSLENKNHPMTSIAYFRIYWKFVEPEQGKYNWPMIDKALSVAHQRQQRLKRSCTTRGPMPTTGWSGGS